MRLLSLFAISVALVFSSGCVHIKIDPIEVRAVVDVNVRVQSALDDFFGDLDQKSSTIVAAPAPDAAG